MAIFRAKNTLLREKAKNFYEILFSLKGPFWGQPELVGHVVDSGLNLPPIPA